MVNSNGINFPKLCWFVSQPCLQIMTFEQYGVFCVKYQVADYSAISF